MIIKIEVDDMIKEEHEIVNDDNFKFEDFIHNAQVIEWDLSR